MNDDKEYPEPEKNECGGYYCAPEVGHIDCGLNRDGTIKIHECCTPGLTMEGVTFEEITNPNSRTGHYWKATQKIGSIFGSEVEGQIEAFGSTKEKAVENLASERQRLNESLWI